jgi:hypothetical protein
MSIDDEEDPPFIARPEPRFATLTFFIVSSGHLAFEVLQRLLDFFSTDPVPEELSQVPVVPIEFYPEYTQPSR